MKKYIIVDLDSQQIVDFADTEDEGALKVMKLGFGKQAPVELYEATGFSSWKDGLRASEKVKNKHMKEESK